jgi:hypothetical protein
MADHTTTTMEIIQIISDGHPKMMSVTTYIVSKTAQLQYMGYNITENETAKAIEDIKNGFYDCKSPIHALVAVDIIKDKKYVTH